MAHSSGYHWNRGSCIYVGGRLQHRSSDGRLEYQSGRISRDTVASDGTASWMVFNNTLIWACQRGINHWGNRAEVRNYECADCTRSAVLFGEALIARALFTVHTGNAQTVNLAISSYEGFQFYDTVWKKKKKKKRGRRRKERKRRKR